MRATDKDRASVYVRDHRFEVGKPLSFDSEHPSATALEHAIGALGADLAVGLRAGCRRARVPVDEVEVLVTAELGNPLTHLGVVGETGSPGLERVVAKVFVRGEALEDDVRDLWSQVVERSPLARTLAQVLELELRVEAAG